MKMGILKPHTSVEETTLTAEATVVTYKNLSVVERALCSFKLVDLQVRPIYHRLANRVRSRSVRVAQTHIFLCMLAYYLEWHMPAALAPMLFDDDKAKVSVVRASCDKITQPLKAGMALTYSTRQVTVSSFFVKTKYFSNGKSYNFGNRQSRLYRFSCCSIIARCRL
jgi:hypothetical protein